ncbi:hypothetical protein [Paenibacillus sp. An7]|uniref:hypothetical protein n=1 Tax=Paenibacillus sp. An7 TaxID=2689577 RepID=UPI00135C2671|nr:hypothetical protein [Paenibacillus sp. An7]
MTSIKATRQPDLVLITWARNPLIPGSPKRIVSVRVIGSSEPCKIDLKHNALLRTALACMLDKEVGFKIIFKKRTSAISGLVLLQR